MPWTGKIARATIAAAMLVLLAGPLIKYGVLPWAAGLGVFAIGALLAGIGGVICVVALVRRRGAAGAVTIVAAVAGLAALLVPVAIVGSARGLPQIHDITTDTADPPRFVEVTAALRGADSNPVGYNLQNAALQTAAYPAVKPLVVADAPGAAFAKALAAARARGWTIVDAKESEGRIEATDTVPWWGFKDDIVVRLRPQASGTRIDVRSKSRVGLGDLGVNAERVTDYLAAIAAR